MNDTTNTMIAILNGPVIDEFNTKLTYIRRIFEYFEFLGITAQHKDKPFWYGNMFDFLYDCENDELERKNQIFHDMADAFIKHQAKGGRP